MKKLIILLFLCWPSLLWADNYHILEQSEKVHQAKVVFHYAVPATTNFAGVSFQAALKQKLEAKSEAGTITSLCPFIPGTELTQLQNGEVYEEVVAVEYNGNWTKAQKRDHIDSVWTTRNTAFQVKIQDQLDFWGYNRNVP